MKINLIFVLLIVTSTISYFTADDANMLTINTRTLQKDNKPRVYYETILIAEIVKAAKLGHSILEHRESSELWEGLVHTLQQMGYTTRIYDGVGAKGIVDSYLLIEWGDGTQSPYLFKDYVDRGVRVAFSR